MAAPKVGEHVWANTGEKDFIGHVAGAPFENAQGETKQKVQTPDGGIVALALRAPGDRDERGAGGTFWPI